MGRGAPEVAFTRIGGPVADTNKKRSELLAELKQLRETQVKHQRLAENASDVIAEVDGHGRFLYVSPNTVRILGYAPDEIVGKTFQEGAIFKNVHPDDRKSLLTRYVEAIQSGSDSVVIYRYRHGDGRWRWFESKAKTYRTSDGSLRAVVISRDVTERVRAQQERRELEQRMQEAQKLESLGVMAGGIAHDFNNLLTPILGGASLAFMDLPPESPARAQLRRIRPFSRQSVRPFSEQNVMSSSVIGSARSGSRRSM